MSSRRTLHGANKKLTSVAAIRNAGPILDVLTRRIRTYSEVLEIASGTGQHVIHFSTHLPNITFQPTDINAILLDSINTYIQESGVKNIRPAIYLDAARPTTWLNGNLKPNTLDCIMNINMIHISEYNCTEGLFEGSGCYLKENGILFMYGPFSRNGIITPESNVRFNQLMKNKSSSWGLRDVEQELIELANKNNLILDEIIDMPANNYVVIWRKMCKGI